MSGTQDRISSDKWCFVVFVVDGKANHAGLAIPRMGLGDLSLRGARIVAWHDKSIPKGERRFYAFDMPHAEAALRFLGQPGLLMKEILREEKACRGWHMTREAPDLVRKYHRIRSRDVDDMNCVEWIVRAAELGGLEMPLDIMTPTELLEWCSENLDEVPRPALEHTGDDAQPRESTGVAM